MVKLARKQLIKKKNTYSRNSQTAQNSERSWVGSIASYGQKSTKKQSNVLSEIRLKIVSLAPNRKQTFFTFVQLR